MKILPCSLFLVYVHVAIQDMYRDILGAVVLISSNSMRDIDMLSVAKGKMLTIRLLLLKLVIVVVLVVLGYRLLYLW